MNLFNPATISTSFEDSTTLGWVGYATTSALASAAGNSSHGSRSMRVTSAAGGTTGVSTSGFHPVTAGQSYSFSFYAVTSLSFQAFAYWYDASGTLVQSYGAGLGAPPGNAGRITWPGHVAPAGATQLKWSIEAAAVPAAGSYYLDAIQYEQATVATPYVPPPGSPPLLTEVHLTLRDGAGQPRPRVHASARVLSPAGYLLDDPEVVRPTATFSDPAGLVSLPLIASSQYTQPGALYEVRYDGRTRIITVPDAGPVDLFDVLVPAP